MAKKEIVINADKEQTRIAILENGELVELYFEDPENERTLGNIYLGRIRRIMPSIKAAFVDIGQKQDAFLHFSDLGDHLPELLEFLEMENPEVGRLALHPDRARARKQRRRPRGQRGRNRPSGTPESGEAAAEAAEGAAEHGADGPEGEAAAGESSPPRRATKAQSRGRRRSAQRPHPGKKDRDSQQPTEEDAEPVKRPEEYLKRGQRILVKIIKEPISNKGSRVSTDISLAGRFLVLVPFARSAAVSKKISSYKERRRLRALAKSLLPDGFGVIVRTVAAGKNAKTLDTDLRLLLEKWRKIEQKLAGKPEPPLLVHEDVNMASSIIRDLFSSDYDRILVDDRRLHRSIKSYVQAVAPQMADAVQLHQSKQPIFDAVKISKDVAGAFQSRVELPSGGYLFIERTEAMHVIDVNSGRSGRGMNQEDSSLKVNLEAARVIARQTRLRDIGGIIVVDFIDMRSEKNRKKVYDELKKEFKKDRAVTKLLPMSDFGLIQITRQRLRPSITTTFSPPNGIGQDSDEGEAGGDGKNPAARAAAQKASTSAEAGAEARPAPPVRAERAPRPEAMLEALDDWIARYRAQGHRRAVTLQVHPFTAAFLNRRVPNYPTRWFMKHLVRIRLETDETMAPGAYRFLDPRSGRPITLPGDEPEPPRKSRQRSSRRGRGGSRSKDKANAQTRSE
ncbi:MAG: Rne/Rng family ribonuclease [Bacteroidetes bacterium]|nr:ribonuclease G [Rhodothermaceae bacterium RA]RMH59874.1 MAG: Rne/Rng family ribonuclease [Bacteroidota bacterium]